MRAVSLRRSLLSLGLMVTAAGATWAVPPTAPTGLTGTILFDTRIDLRWTDNSSNETGFLVWRRADAGDWRLLGSTSPNVTTWRDLDVDVDHNYHYQVRAINLDGGSGWSNELSFTCPLAPTNFTVTSGAKGVDMRWTDSSDNETAFAVWRQGVDGVWTRINSRPPNFVQYTDTTSGVKLPVPPVRMTPLAVDRRFYATGREITFLLGTTTAPPVWRISLPAATTDDLEWMLRDGVENLACTGDRLVRDPDIVSIGPQIQAAVTQLLALAQGSPAYQSETLARYQKQNPRIIRLPLVDATTSKVVSVAEFWLTGATERELKGYFLSQTTAPGPNIRYRLRAINNSGASPWTPEVVFPGSVVSGTVPLY